TRTFQPSTGYLSRQLAQATSGAVIQDDNYLWYTNGDLLERSDHTHLVGSDYLKEQFTYDSVDRLASATVPGRSTPTFNYTYDAIGNVKLSTGDMVCTDYTYPTASQSAGPHQLTKATCSGTVGIHTYDGAGNELSSPSPAAREQTWTSFSKPIEIRSAYGR